MEVPKSDVVFRENVYPSSEIKIECENTPAKSEMSKVGDTLRERSLPNKLNVSCISSPTVYTNKDIDSGLTNGCSNVNKKERSQFLPKFKDDRKGSAGLEYENRINKIEQIVDETISPESHLIVTELLQKISQLSVKEKLLLYLKLPTGKEVIDPLRLPLNPLGSRSEICQTITWIRTHLEEDPDVSLPKQDVYDEYKIYCENNKVKPLSTADFGKVMKQVFPSVRPRRLGTRGNSRYCYAGLQKRRQLKPPKLPIIRDDGETLNANSPLSSAVCAWANKILSTKFTTLKELGRYILSLGDAKPTRNSALTSSIEFGTGVPSSVSLCPSCLRIKPTESPTQFRKTQEKEIKRKFQYGQSASPVNRPQIKMKSPEVCKSKRTKMSVPKTSNRKGKKQTLSNSSVQEPTLAVTSTNSAHQSALICDNINHNWVKEDLSCKKSEQVNLINDLKPGISTNKTLITPTKEQNKHLHSECRISNKRDVDSNHSFKLDSSFDCQMKEEESVVREKSNFSPLREVSNRKENNDNDALLVTQELTKFPIPRLPKQLGNKQLGTNIVILPATLKPQSKFRQYKPIQPRPEKIDSQEVKKMSESGGHHSEKFVNGNSLFLKTEDSRKIEHKNSKKFDETSIGCLEKNAVDDFLHDDGNSQEQEEELLHYFQSSVNTDILRVKEQHEKSEKLSQLRLLLEKNVNSSSTELVKNTSVQAGCENSLTHKAVSVAVDNNMSDSVGYSNSDVFITGQTQTRPDFQFSLRNKISSKPSLVLPSLLVGNSVIQTRRRVSFENLPDTIPPSPNTRRQVFNFTPISPRPYSSTKTKPLASENPFVSPKDTPLTRTKYQGNSSSSSSQNNSSPLLPNITSLIKTGNSPSRLLSRSASVSISPSPNPHLQPRSISSISKLYEISTEIPVFQDMSKQKLIQTEGGQLNCTVSPVKSNADMVLLSDSPVSTCDSSMFHFQNKISPQLINNIQDEVSPSSSAQIPSLLQTILMSKSGDCSNIYKEEKRNDSIPCEMSLRSLKSSDPLSPEVSTLFPEDNSQFQGSDFHPAFRSQSVPMVSNSVLISPQSTTHPFPLYCGSNVQYARSPVVPTPVPSELTDFGGTINVDSSSDYLLLTDNNGTENVEGIASESSTEPNNILMESAMNKIFDMIVDASKTPLVEMNECSRFQQPSKSYPNTPTPYNVPPSNSRDPIVSAFAPNPPLAQQISRSYPSTPVFSKNLFSDTTNNFGINQDVIQNTPPVGRQNMNILLQNPAESLSLLTEDDLALHSLAAEIPGCEDTFNDLAREVTNDVVEGPDL